MSNLPRGHSRAQSRCFPRTDSIRSLLQFLVEAIVLSLFGGSIGIALGYGLSEGLTFWLQWPTAISVSAIAVAFGFAGATGVFFGFYPARKAAALDPIEALRFE